MADLRADSESIQRLAGNANWGHYVNTLTERYQRAVVTLLINDHPDEALRGEARALLKELQFIQRCSKTT